MDLTKDEILFLYEAVSKRALELAEYDKSMSFKIAMKLKSKLFQEIKNG